MKKLKLKEKEVVHCATLKQAKKVLKIAHKLGCYYGSGRCLLSDFNYNYWNNVQENTIYYFKGKKITVGILDVSKERGYTVITSKEFIKRHKKKNKYKALEDRIKLIESIYNQELLTVNTHLSKCIEDVEVLQAIVNGTNESVAIVNPNNEQPQIGDVVKAWDDDKSKFVYGVYNGREEYEGYYIVGEVWHENIEKVTEISINDFRK